jgi:pyrroloquinoline quinone biosynthesis protein B
MRLIVLGSGAGGGVPQWNCACANCTNVRRGLAPARTQASLAVSADGESWLLLGASPDVRVQVAATPALWPRKMRHSPIAGAALPNGDLDAWVGLLTLREWTPLLVFATEPVRRDLDANPVLRTLERFPGQSVYLDLVEGERLPAAEGLSLEAVPVPGKVPVHMVGHRSPHPLDNVGFVVRDEKRGKSAAWFPSVARPTPALERALAEVDAVFFDGTFFGDNELAEMSARELGHWPVAESAPWLARLPARHKWLVHVNNTNPLLADPTLAAVPVAYDGLEVEL